MQNQIKGELQVQNAIYNFPETATIFIMNWHIALFMTNHFNFLKNWNKNNIL